ncbi:MAG: patatin-like phospholipase family protein [Pegethrix bostrychoides GSE-TBD4-15B]|jgi:predicted acylesterase/phospholipase RssA|uniref:Patatin-like phospholipase family protein n=1 Tax=Pegethrix bostrychoides GSE-TBD4-15B TaxID=2839662 RepID=A0A951PCH2_9CYAN|nr:patatin-like phospholipase family protein [Pegethrix bostrychoides GSE-TBD4-15B]
MPQKLAITISGAVSLGSYEAGVLYEMIEAIAQHNGHPDTAPNQQIEIDVITGASAGAMTACILAQKLMFEAEALRQPYANALYKPWVEDVDITRLLNLRPDEDPNFSILSSDQIAEIGARYVLQRYAAGLPTPRQRHPASAASIRLGIAMSNLNGVDYAVEITDFPDVMNPDSRARRMFTYTRHQDFLTHEVTDSDDSAQVWRGLEKAARSSGAFPFAFRPLQIERQGSDPSYDRSVLSPGSYSFVYTDGGVFENEPLGLAKDLVDQIDVNHQDHHSRFYLYVSPGAKSSTANPDIRAENATYLKTGAALASAIFTQARFQNWVTTSKVNQKIRQFEQQSKELSDILLKSPQLQASFSQVGDSLLAVLYPAESPVEQRYQMSTDRDRLRQQFTEEYDRLVYGLTQTALPIGGEAVAESWLKLVQALEKVQNLGSKDVMTVYAITSDDLELAGEQLFAFGGFLDQSFRDFDYNLGRRKAMTFLQKLQALHRAGKSEGQLYLLNFAPGHALPPIADDLGKVDLRQVPRQTRTALKAQLLDRGGRIVESVEGRFWVRWLLKLSLKFFLGKKLDELLRLD